LQKKGLPNRRIEQLLLNVQAIFEIAEEKYENLNILLVDFEKAFDHLSHDFIFKILKALGFGEIMQNWIKLLYKNTYSNIEINGALTETIQIKRGISQGCPIMYSPGMLKIIKQ